MFLVDYDDITHLDSVLQLCQAASELVLELQDDRQQP